MMSAIWRFVKRHRRKFYFLGAVTVGAAAAWHFLLPRFRRLMSGEGTGMNAELMKLARHHQHQDSTLHNCDSTSASLLPQLQARLTSLIDTDALLAELRLPAGTASSRSRVELWQDLKLRVITRTLVALYSACLLAELVHVQLSLLGGYIFLHTSHRDMAGDDSMELTDGVKLAYLSCWKHVLDTDTAHLTERIEAIAARVISPVSLQEAMSLRRLDTLLHEIRLEFESELESCVRLHVRTAMPTEETETSIVDQAVLARLVRETQELVDCSDFLGVYKACLDSAFSSLLDHLAEEFHRAGSGASSENYVSIYDVRIPFAKVVPLVDNVANVLLSGDINSQFNRDLLSTDVLKAFSRNIHDTFSGKERKT